MTKIYVIASEFYGHVILKVHGRLLVLLKVQLKLYFEMCFSLYFSYVARPCRAEIVVFTAVAIVGGLQM